MSDLTLHERPAAGQAEGLLILHHGRGTDELDLLPLAEALDPERRLLVITPRAPLQLPGSPGYHWYLVPNVGHPDPQTFAAARLELARLHDELWQQTGISPRRTLLAGFSMGAVMSYTLGLDGERPAPAGIMAFSGFMPTIAGWSPDLQARAGLPVFVTHGRRDQVIDVAFAREAVERLSEAGLAVDYHESDAAHHIDPREIPTAGAWLKDTLRARAATAGAHGEAPRE